MTIIAAALAAYAASVPTHAFDGRANTVGASDVGQCARKVFFTKHAGNRDYGALPDPGFVDGWGARQRGSTFEQSFWVPALRARYGARLLFAGEQQETFTLGFLSATPDGLLTALDPDVLAPLGVADIGGDGSLVVECKTIDPRARLDGARPEHVYQAQVQLGLIRALTSHRPAYALISYVDASFWDLVTEFAVAFDRKVFKTAQRRAAEIMTVTSADMLAPEGWIAGASECAHCAFTHACGNIRALVPESAAAASPEVAAEVAALARRAQHHERERDAEDVAFRTAQHVIKERLRAAGARRAVADGVSVTWSPVRGRPSYDVPAICAAAAAAGIDLTKFEAAGRATDRLEIRAATPRPEQRAQAKKENGNE